MQGKTVRVHDRTSALPRWVERAPMMETDTDLYRDPVTRPGNVLSPKALRPVRHDPEALVVDDLIGDQIPPVGSPQERVQVHKAAPSDRP